METRERVGGEGKAESVGSSGGGGGGMKAERLGDVY
jgi:hypothetical protein